MGKIFTVVSMGRNGQGRARKFRAGLFELCGGLWAVEAIASCLIPGCEHSG